MRNPRASGLLWLVAGGLAGIVALLVVAIEAVLWIPSPGKPLAPEAMRRPIDNEAAKAASRAWKTMPPEEKETRRRVVVRFDRV